MLAVVAVTMQKTLVTVSRCFLAASLFKCMHVLRCGDHAGRLVPLRMNVSELYALNQALRPVPTLCPC
eukprot:59204-Pleurochrysis_carterae.AAC.1